MAKINLSSKQVAIDTKWQHYENEVTIYRSIADAPFYILHSDTLLNKEQALETCYAMLKNRPIITTSTIDFDSNTVALVQDIITKRIHSYRVMNISEIGLTELSILINKLRPTNYNLSQREKTLIRAYIRAHFRDLVKHSA